MSSYKKLTQRIVPLVMGIGIPSSLRSLSQYFQQIIDTMFIGQYDSNSLLAISSVIIPFWMFESFWIGIISSTTVMIAQKLGAKNNLSATKIAQTTFVLGGVLALVYFFFWQNMSYKVAEFMNLQANPAQQAISYIRIVAFVYFFRFVGIGAPSSVLEAIGNTRIIMWATLAQTITNISLDPILIWGWGFIPEMGIKGAAVATVVAELVACSILSTHFWKHNYLKLRNHKILPLQWDLKQRFVLGIPMTIEILIWSLSTSTIISMMNATFPLGGAIFNVGFLLSDMCFRLLYGFDVANMSLMGRSFGAKRKDRMVAVLTAITKMKWITGLIIVALSYILRYQIVRLFSNNSLIIQTTLDNFMWILSIALVTLSVGINMSTLSSMGYSRYNLYVSLFAIPLRVLLSYWVLYYTEYGIVGIWMATIVEEGLRIVLTYVIRNHMLRKYWNQWQSL